MRKETVEILKKMRSNAILEEESLKKQYTSENFQTGYARGKVEAYKEIFMRLSVSEKVKMFS